MAFRTNTLHIWQGLHRLWTARIGGMVEGHSRSSEVLLKSSAAIQVLQQINRHHITDLVKDLERRRSKSHH